jgi:hypothetical protein
VTVSQPGEAPTDDSRDRENDYSGECLWKNGIIYRTGNEPCHAEANRDRVIGGFWSPGALTREEMIMAFEKYLMVMTSWTMLRMA